ncbi:Glutaminyl-peptide cyclotransferase [Balamuthia mandrillaris]
MRSNLPPTSPRRSGPSQPTPYWALVVVVLAAVTCWTSGVGATPNQQRAVIPTLGYRVIHEYRHDSEAFTQGLLYDPSQKNILYEGTGLYYSSTLRKVDLRTGHVQQSVALPERVFGEGITLWQGDVLFQLTWTSRKIYKYRKHDLALLHTYDSPLRQGWGITTTEDQSALVLSDGSHNLYFFDPETMHKRKTVAVTGVANPRWNELEWINGTIWANSWLSNDIYLIDPESGAVKGKLDLAHIIDPHPTRLNRDNVLNGIAYDPIDHRLFVTGKRWPKIFEIAVDLTSSS